MLIVFISISFIIVEDGGVVMGVSICGENGFVLIMFGKFHKSCAIIQFNLTFTLLM
jgi:hypothetical protein